MRGAFDFRAASFRPESGAAFPGHYSRRCPRALAGVGPLRSWPALFQNSGNEVEPGPVFRSMSVMAMFRH